MEIVVKGEDATMFSEEELKDMSGLKRGPDYVEVTCGCTSRKYGDSIGKLRVFATGQFVISCECTPHCQEPKLSLDGFEKHAGREGARKWKSHIWVLVHDKKVPLWRTVLLKYYKHGSNEANGSGSSCKSKTHRDEFIKCTKCGKERRFRLRTKQECRIHHDALANKSWNCADSPYENITCADDQEERESRKSCRGCPRLPTCNGCTICVCFGCLKCCFTDCNCRNCVDFMQNAEP